ncbi:hypothetical protein PM082_017949 [Marasmius tenuissimus]|nr:hypothetical protein PM082_017949 [Marasmius tenuissimus]
MNSSPRPGAGDGMKAYHFRVAKRLSEPSSDCQSHANIQKTPVGIKYLGSRLTIGSIPHFLKETRVKPRSCLEAKVALRSAKSRFHACCGPTG